MPSRQKIWYWLWRIVLALPALVVAIRFSPLYLWNTLITLAFIFIGIEMANNPPKKDGHKTRYRVVFAVLGLVALILSYFQEQDSNTKITTLTNAGTKQINMMAGIKSTQAILAQNQQGLSMAIATNSNISAGLRQAIINQQKDFKSVNTDILNLDTWTAEYKIKIAQAQLQREKEKQEQEKRQQEEARVLRERAAPTFQYAIDSLTAIARTIAIQTSNKVVSSVSEIPSILTPNNTPIGQIKLEPNSKWIFDISVQGSQEQIWAALTIRSRDAALNITVFSVQSRLGQVNVSLQIEGQQPIRLNKEMADYESAVNEGLKNLIAAQSEQNTKTNK